MSRRSLYAIFFLLFWSAHGAQVNISVDDTDPSFVYLPSTAWNTSQVVCPSCNNPPVLLALRQTYHKGLHVDGPDADDFPQPSASSRQSVPSSKTAIPPISSPVKAPPPPAPSAPPTEEDEVPGQPDDDHDADDNKNKGKGKGGPGRRDFVPRLDLDDAGFVDIQVFAQVNFSGTAVYVYCIQPLELTMFPNPPSLMNITFFLDSNPITTYTHQGSTSGSGFAGNVHIFGISGLVDGPHILKMQLAPNSVLILDSILVTQNVADPSQGVSEGNVSPSPIQSQISTQSSASGTSEKGRDSFAGALAGSLGVLGILGFGTAISIYTRRRRAARRDRLERPPASSMIGPATFIPRYFPGTVVSTTPPPYTPSSSASSIHSSPRAQEPLLPQPASYADIPPPLEELVPPPFGAAIASPAATLLSSTVPPHMVALPPSRPTSFFSYDEDDRV